MKQKTKIIYYTDELKDEFSGTDFVPKKIDGSYSYEGGFLRKIGHIFWYHIIAIPCAYLFLYLKFHHKIVNHRLLKEAKGAYFLYGNHTQQLADALIPTVISRPKDMYVIVHADNVSIPFLGKLTPGMGAIPLPDNGEAVKNFKSYIKEKIAEGAPISIYPEAHIWPYYTGIRPFGAASFGYPIQCNVPVYCFTNTYQKRKKRKTPQLVTYIDGPFYAKEGLLRKEQKEELRNRIYETMLKRSENSNMEWIKYVKANMEANRQNSVKEELTQGMEE